MATGLVRWNPWNDLFNIHDQMGQLFNSAFGSEAFLRGPVANLAIDIRQTDKAYIIEASVPGFTPGDIDVTLDESVLTIKGRVNSEAESHEGGYLHRERRQSSVFRQVTLPNEIRAEEISAEFNNGVLTVTVPRAQKAEPKRIEVNHGAGTVGKVVDAASH